MPSKIKSATVATIKSITVKSISALIVRQIVIVVYIAEHQASEKQLFRSTMPIRRTAFALETRGGYGEGVLQR